MVFADDAALDDVEYTVEQWLGKALPPWPGGTQALGQWQIQFGGAQFAIAEDLVTQIPGIEMAPHLFIEGPAETVQVRLRQRQSGGHGVTTKFAQQIGVALGHCVQRVADVQTRHRARRALDFILARLGEDDHRPVQAVLDPRGEDADHPRMPVRLEQAQAHGQPGVLGQFHFVEDEHRFGLHFRLDITPLAIQFVQPLRQQQGRVRVVGEQAFDAQRHVLQPPGGIQPWAEGEAQIRRHQLLRAALGDADQRTDAGTALAPADARQALGDEDAVVVLQRHHVGHRAQRHQIQQAGQVGLIDAAFGEPARLAQPRAQGQHDVEDHPHAGRALGGEGIAGPVGIDDGVRRWQGLAGQVVVGDQHAHAQRPGRRHAVEAGDAVVHRDQQIGLARRSHGDDLRRQSVAVFEAVGHQIVHLRRPHGAQRPHPQRRAGGAVGIEIADDEDALPFAQGLRQQVDGGIDAEQPIKGQQFRQRTVQFVGRCDTARGVDARQQGGQLAGQTGGNGGIGTPGDGNAGGAHRR